MVSADICVQSIPSFDKWNLSPDRRALSMMLRGRRQARFGIAEHSILGIQRHELAHHPVGPAEAVLIWILTAAARATGGDDIVFLHQLAVLAVHAIDSDHPATGNGLGQRQNGVFT